MAPVSGKDVMGVRLIVVGVVFSILAIIAIGGRVWARRLKKAGTQLNDYLAFLALAFTLALNATCITGAFSGGAGQHTESVSLTEDVVLAKCFLAAGVLWALSIACIKLSILAFYISIFRVPIFVASAYVIAALSISLMVAVAFANMLICRPLSYNWDRSGKGTCGNMTAFYLGSSIANLLIDVSVVVLPMPMLWSLQMKRSRKIALTLVFGLGAFVCAVSIVRVVAIHSLSEADLSYTTALDGIWSILEPSLGVVASCLPIMQPVLSRVSEITSKLFSWTKDTSQRSLRASSRRLPDHDQNPLTKPSPEDRLYPLSNLGETINEIETTFQSSDLEASTRISVERGYGDKRTIEVKRGYDVRSTMNV